MAERCRWCGSGEMLSMTKHFEDGRTLDYRVCSHYGHVEYEDNVRPMIAQRGQASQRVIA